MNMNKKFKLQKVLDVREIIEMEKMKNLAFSRKELELEKQRMRKLENEIRQLAFEMNESGTATVCRFSGFHDYLNTLAGMLYEKRHAIFVLKKAVEEKRQDLLQASKDKKVLELLKEKTRTAFAMEENREEQKVLDELAIRTINSYQDEMT